jgi:hypothetical protein
VLARILAALPFRKRMQVSLVGPPWAAAAVLANTHVEVNLLDQAACQGQQDWLQLHAGRLRYLSADAQEVYRARTQLPWERLSQLVSLRLRSLKVEQPPASIHSTHDEGDAAAALASASSNNSSSDAVLAVPAAAAAAAGFLPALQRLELVNCTYVYAAAGHLPAAVQGQQHHQPDNQRLTA